MSQELLDQPLNPELLQQILAFFKKNGLTEAEEALSRETAAVLRLSKDSVEIGDANNDAMIREYSALLNHISASFDNYRAELSALLYPVFAHFYIQQILEGHSLSAAVFSEKFARSIPSIYEEQVCSLTRISTHGQAANHPLVHALTKNQFVVRMSKSAIKQLEPFLNRNSIIRDLIREHLVIEAVDGPRTKAAIEATMGGIIGQVSKQDRKHKMYYGTVKDDLSSPLGVEKKKSKGKDRSDSKKKDANGPVPDRIPLPAPCEKRLLCKEPLTKKIRISSESPPSVCLYTALNAHGGLTSADISEDSTFLALGYGSSLIQVHALGEEKFRPLKKIDQLEAIDQESEDSLEQIYDDSQATNILTFTGHSGPVFSLSFSPDKRLLLSSCRDSTIRLWSLGARQNVVIYRQSMPVWQAQFCSRSYYFATGGADGTAKLWATDRLQPLRIFADSLSDVSCIDFHPNCNYIAGGSDDRYVRVWDVLSGVCVRCFSGHKGAVRTVKTSPCGRYLASIGAEGSIIIWDMAMQRMLCMCDTTPFSFSTAMAFSRDGSALAVARADCALSFYLMDSIISSMNLQDHLNQDPKINPSGFHLSTYATKNTPILDLHFTRRNLVLAVGSYGQ